ncbi:MAG TPA: glycosyltransferase family 4 protein [Gemmatimonadaceae bacterium]|nr:glycosyltransferase family 4 protein [Gemmatimonadaceae bacterium]
MKVLMLTPMVPSERAASAGPIVMYDEVAAVASRHDVTLATLTTGDDADAVRRLGALGVRVHAVPRREVNGVRGLLQRARIGLHWRTTDLPLRTVIFREPEMQHRLDELSATPFDVVHIVDNAMAVYRRPRASFTVLSEHDVRVDAEDGAVDAASTATLRDAERERWQQYQSRVWSEAGRVQVFTARDAACVRQIAPAAADRVYVNPFGVDVRPLASQPPGDGASLVFVGGFLHPPNVHAARWLVTEILPLVQASHPQARLTIVGADPPDVVRALASDTVQVTGRVTAVEPFVESATVMVAPIRAGGGMRRKVLEAMALSRPVVTTTRGAEGIWNPPAAPTLRIADDATAIARHITALLDSPDERRALGSAAWAAVAEHHQRAGFGDRLLALYDSLRQPGVAA